MAESAPSGKLIVDARGTERNVLEPKPIVSENPFKEKAEAAAAGLGAALVVEAVETIREKIKHTKSEKVENKNDRETETKSYNFNDIETNLMSGKLDTEQERYFQTIRKTRIEEFNNVDNGEFIRDTRIAVTRILKNNDWDDVYDELTHYGETRESEMRGRAEIDDRLNGISMAAVRYEAARVLGAGLVKKRREVGQKKYEKWIKEEKSDQYSKEEIETLQKLAKRSFVRLAPDAPEELVGRNIKKDEVDNLVQPQPREIKITLPEKDIDAGFESQLQEQVKKLKKEKAEASEWAKVVLEGIDFAEKESDKERKKSIKDEKPEYWDALEKAIQEIPNNLGSIDKTSDLAKFLSKEYKNGLTFKDRLSILFTARKHLNDRFIEMSRAGGSLTKMGVSDEMPFEGISYKVQTISPEDFEMLYHTGELFPELSELPATELRELLPDLDEASCKWLDVGIKNSSIPEDIMTNEEIAIIRKILKNKEKIINYYLNKISEKTKEFNSKKHTNEKDDEEKKEFDRKIKKINKNITDITKMSIDFDWISFKVLKETQTDLKILNDNDILTYAYIPTFNNSLNNATTQAELRKRMSTSLKSNKAEDLAFRVLTNTLTFEMLDRGRTNVQGSSEPRDIIWAERKRLFEMEKEREPGLDWTVHRYFVTRPDPGDVIEENGKSELTSKKLVKRREILNINAERGVLVEKHNHFEGEIVSDFFHNAMIFAPDELDVGKSIRRNLATYVLNGDGSVKKGGFKNMPFLKMGPESYSTAGYWGYTIAKAKQLATEISSTTYKKADEELVTDDWWNKKRDLFGRLEHISPRLITIEFKARGEEIRKLLEGDKRFNSVIDQINKIAGYSESEDLDVITDPRLQVAAKQVILDDIENAKKEKKRLNKLAEEAKTSGKKKEESGLREEIKKVKNVIERANDRAETIRNMVIDKFRMIHALGVVWAGSIDAIEGTSTIFGESSISPDLLTKITRAIEASRYLEGEYLQQFKYETAEMGFGSRLIVTKKRYRLEINQSLWD
jgi:DNA-binding transcriptional ArsR family regulator